MHVFFCKIIFEQFFQQSSNQSFLNSLLFKIINQSSSTELFVRILKNFDDKIVFALAISDTSLIIFNIYISH